LPTRAADGRPPRRFPGRSHREAGARQPMPCLLPPDLPLYVGRVEEIDVARRQLTDRAGPATLVVTGPAGIGKTAFVVRLGHTLAGQFPDGQLYVDLQGFGDDPAQPAAVLGTFLRALGVRGGAVPGDLTSRIHLYWTLLARRRALVILDNAADARQVRDLLPNGSQCAAIVTGRSTLAGLGGNRMQLEILTSGQALTLLANMIGSARTDAEPAAARSIVDACDRLPLAVWVAGARLAARPHWSLTGIAQALADEQRKLDELTVGDVAVRASLELTYRAMPPETRHALRMLSLLPRPDFAGWALAALLDTTAIRAERLLDELVEVHLVEIGAVTAAGTRYRLHDLVHLLGRERAGQEDDAAERDDALGRVLSASLHLADIAAHTLSADFQGISQQHLAHWRLAADEANSLLVDPLSWLSDEHDFLVAVVDQALESRGVNLAACLATALTTFFQIGSHFDEWERLQTKALAAALRTADQSSASKLHRCLGELTTILDRYPEALIHFQQALRLAVPDDPAYTASATAGLAYVHRLLGRYGSAVAYFGQAAQLARAAGNVNCLVYATNGIGVVELEQGRVAVARQRFEECLEVSRSGGYRPGEAQALRCLGQSHRVMGEYDLAADCFRQAAAVSTELGDRLGATHANCWLGEVWVRAGRYRDGRRLLAQSLWIYREFGNVWGEAAALYGLAEAQLAAGRPAQARRRAEAVVALWRQIGANHWLAIGLETLAEALLGTGDGVAASVALTEAAAVRRGLAARDPDDPSGGDRPAGSEPSRSIACHRGSP
jgi:tetratricopeptide (TPR) repeat protein